MGAPVISFRYQTTDLLVSSPISLTADNGGPIPSNSSSKVLGFRVYNNAGLASAYSDPVASVADASNVKLAAYDDATGSFTAIKPVVGANGANTPWVHVAQTAAGERKVNSYTLSATGSTLYGATAGITIAGYPALITSGVTSTYTGTYATGNYIFVSSLYDVTNATDLAFAINHVVVGSPATTQAIAAFTQTGLDGEAASTVTMTETIALTNDVVNHNHLLQFKMVVYKDGDLEVGRAFKYPDVGDDPADPSTWHTVTTDSDGSFLWPITPITIAGVPALLTSGVATKFQSDYTGDDGVYQFLPSIKNNSTSTTVDVGYHSAEVGTASKPIAAFVFAGLTGASGSKRYTQKVTITNNGAVGTTTPLRWRITQYKDGVANQSQVFKWFDQTDYVASENISNITIGGNSQHSIILASNGAAQSVIRASDTVPLSGYIDFNMRVDVPSGTGRSSISFSPTIVYEYI